MYKTKHKLGPSFLNHIFTINYEKKGPQLRSKSELIRPNINTVHYGEDSLKYLGSVIWQPIPQGIKDIDNLDQFKRKIKGWAP